MYPPTSPFLLMVLILLPSILLCPSPFPALRQKGLHRPDGQFTDTTDLLNVWPGACHHQLYRHRKRNHIRRYHHCGHHGTITIDRHHRSASSSSSPSRSPSQSSSIKVALASNIRLRRRRLCRRDPWHLAVPRALPRARSRGGRSARSVSGPLHQVRRPSSARPAGEVWNNSRKPGRAYHTMPRSR